MTFVPVSERSFLVELPASPAKTSCGIPLCGTDGPLKVMRTVGVAEGALLAAAGATLVKGAPLTVKHAVHVAVAPSVLVTRTSRGPAASFVSMLTRRSRVLFVVRVEISSVQFGG